MDETSIDWIANEGARVSAIVADLKVAVGAHPVLKPVLDQQQPPAPIAIEKAVVPPSVAIYGTDVWVEQSGDAVSLVVPIRVPMPLFIKRPPPAPIPPVAPAPAPIPGATTIGPATGPGGPRIGAATGMLMEAVHINQDTLNSRPGYKANFIGSGKFSVPLPKIPTSLKPKVATLKSSSAQSELKYFNYSVVMNKERKLAFFSCVNIDGGKQQDVGKREGDSWLRAAHQCRFPDRRRILPQAIDIRSGSNRQPVRPRPSRPPSRCDLGRHGGRSQGTWRRFLPLHQCLAAILLLQPGQAIVGGTGGLYPRCPVERRRERHRDERTGVRWTRRQRRRSARPCGRPHPDPTFGGVKIPKYFWKILITKGDNGLKAMAFLMSQRNLIMDIDRIQEADMLERLSEADVRVFQVSIGDLTKLTKLDFGNLVDADAHEATSVGPRRIETFEDIRT